MLTRRIERAGSDYRALNRQSCQRANPSSRHASRARVRRLPISLAGTTEATEPDRGGSMDSAMESNAGGALEAVRGVTGNAQATLADTLDAGASALRERLGSPNDSG